jgi:anti-sigma factor RsiW
MVKRCGRIRRQIDAFMQNQLPPEDRRRVREHLENCEKCRAFRDEWLRLNKSLAGALVQFPAPNGFADDVLREVRREAETRGKQDWTWLDFAVRFVAAAALCLSLAAIGWMGWQIDGSGSRDWRVPSAVWFHETQMGLSGQADSFLASARQEWLQLLLMPDRVIQVISKTWELWSHPAVPVAVLMVAVGLTAGAVSWFRTDQTVQ